MKKIAIILSKIPHGNSQGREALDAALALSDINSISFFFIGDGVFHLLPDQQPDKILGRDYISTFGLLVLYDITQVYACQEDIDKRYVTLNTTIPIIISDKKTISQCIHRHDMVIRF